MLETSQLDKLAAPLKWGFLADNVLLLLQRRAEGEVTLNENEKDILRGAIEFLELVQAAIKNLNTQAAISGDLSQRVESLTLYNYVLQSEEFPVDQISDLLKKLNGTLQSWVAGTAFDQKECEPLHLFFKAISKTTLQESNELLTPRPRLSVPG